MSKEGEMNRRSTTGLLGLLAALLGIRVLYWLEDLIEGLFSPFSKILTTPIAVWPLANSSDDEDGPQSVFFRHEMRRSRKHRKSLSLHIRVYGEMSERRNITQVEYERFINKVRFNREALSAEIEVSRTCHRAIQIQQLY